MKFGIKSYSLRYPTVKITRSVIIIIIIIIIYFFFVDTAVAPFFTLFLH